MAGTTTFRGRHSDRESAERQALVEINHLVTDVETLRQAVVALAAAASQPASVAAIAAPAALIAAPIAGSNGVPFAD